MKQEAINRTNRLIDTDNRRGIPRGERAGRRMKVEEGVNIWRWTDTRLWVVNTQYNTQKMNCTLKTYIMSLANVIPIYIILKSF